MANPVIRTRILELLVSGDFTVTELADRLAVPYNSAAKAIARAMEEGQVHVCGYAARAAAIYRLGAGVASPVAPDPVASAESQYEHRPLNAKERGMVEQAVEYFEISDLLPGVKQFTCARYRATLSVESCADRFRKANGNDPDVHVDRYHECRRCPLGALHSGAGRDLNLGRVSRVTICGRCRAGATRLIGKHLCVSCYNRQREWLLGKNAKGTKPVKLAPLDPRRICYMSGKAPKTLYMPLTVDTEELIISALRDEKQDPRFGHSPASMAWLLDGNVYDRSIGDAVDVADAAVPVPSEIDVVQADPAAQTTSSKRVAKKVRQHARRQVRVSNVTVNLLRSVGALPPPSPAISPVPAPASYSAALFSV